MTIPIVISGACGRMGTAIAHAVAGDPGAAIAGALEHPRHPLIGKSLEDALKLPAPGITLEGDPRSVLAQSRRRCVWIEFTSPKVTLEHLKLIAPAGHPMVIGTTGLSSGDIVAVRRLSGQAAVLLAPNMSFGMNVLYHLVREATRLLGPEYEVEILEAHHGMKLDAPSGTAMRLAEVVTGERSQKPGDALVFDRSKLRRKRSKTEVGMSVLRIGDVVGEHTVYFGSSGERIELSHRASSRVAFVSGAIRSAKWIHRKRRGLFSFSDVLGLT